MVFRKISPDMKERALSLYFQGHIPKDICHIFGFSEKSLRRWREHTYVHGNVIPPPAYLQGRPRKLNSDQISDLMDHLLVNPDLYLDEIQTWVAVHQEVGISSSSLARLIEDVGFSYKFLHKAAAERDEAEREEFRAWARETLVPEMIVAADESSKDDRTIYRHCGRSPSGMRAPSHTQFVRGERYSLIAAMSVDGYISTRVVGGSVDTAEFFDFIVGDVVSTSLHYAVFLLSTPTFCDSSLQ
jgi:transposase